MRTDGPVAGYARQAPGAGSYPDHARPAAGCARSPRLGSTQTPLSGSPLSEEENTVRTSALRRTAAAVLLSAVAFGLAACDNNQEPATNYPSQSYGNAPSTTTDEVPSESTNPSTNPSTGASTGASVPSSAPAGATTTTP
jgi:hypothetical protein